MDMQSVFSKGQNLSEFFLKVFGKIREGSEEAKKMEFTLLSFLRKRNFDQSKKIEATGKKVTICNLFEEFKCRVVAGKIDPFLLDARLEDWNRNWNTFPTPE